MRTLAFGFILAGLTAGCATGGFTTRPVGVQHYRYEQTERVPGQPDKGYRLDYDLETTPLRVTAIVRRAQEGSGGQWRDAEVSAACATAMHAEPGELARVTLSPIEPEAAATMNDAFLSQCAPAAIFYPITDILNVSLVQTSTQFGLRGLHAPGDRFRFQGYATQFERLGVAVSLAAPGGETRLTALDPRAATVDWVSDPLQLGITRRATSTEPEIRLSGVERFAFRLVIDARTGVLERAATTSDALDLLVSVPGLAPERAPRLAITREVSIERVSNSGQ